MEQQKTKRQLQAEKTKLHIFHAALRLLEQQDFEAITVRDIVQEAGVSIGSFYNAYASKLDVFYKTYQIADEYFESYVRPQLTQENPVDRIFFFFSEYARYNSENSSLSLTKLLYNPNNPYFRRTVPHGMLPILTEQVQYALDHGAFRSERTAEDIAQYLMVCIRGVVYDWCLANGTYPLSPRIQEYVGLLIQAFL